MALVLTLQAVAIAPAPSLLAMLVHRHRVSSLLNGLLLLEILLVLKSLLLVGCHGVRVRWHLGTALLEAGLRGCDGWVGFFWRVDGGLAAVDAIRVGWLGSIEAGLSQCQRLLRVVSIVLIWMRSYLDEVLSFGLGDKRLKFGCGEGVDESGF